MPLLSDTERHVIQFLNGDPGVLKIGARTSRITCGLIDHIDELFGLRAGPNVVYLPLQVL